MVMVIVRFLTYRERHLVFSKKKELKGHVDKTFITENKSFGWKITITKARGNVYITNQIPFRKNYNLNINTKYFIYNKRQNI
jgi:hypothetical protein